MPAQLGNIKLFDVQNLAKKSGMNPVSVRTLFREGKLKGRKVGRRWYISEEALRDYFEEPRERTKDGGPTMSPAKGPFRLAGK